MNTRSLKSHPFFQSVNPLCLIVPNVSIASVVGNVGALFTLSLTNLAWFVFGNAPKDLCPLIQATLANTAKSHLQVSHSVHCCFSNRFKFL